MMQKFLISLVAIALYCSTYFGFRQQPFSVSGLFSPLKIGLTAKSQSASTIQVALLLDTSGSMRGLIEQAKSQLWNILNELARTKKNDQEVTLEMALYEYGNPTKGNAPYFIHQLTPFTTDMDLISQQLFSLTTNGGDEYCGSIIQSALQELEWKSDDELKIIYIAGNEPFTQGPISYKTACYQAQEKGITVHTIYCGDYETGMAEQWKASAQAGGGDYFNIDHNEETVYIKTPYDDQINQLNMELNNTYIPYGELGQVKKENQMVQDQNASTFGTANFADRAAFKSSAKYTNAGWDLVDAYKKDKDILKKAEVKADSLQNLTADELEARVLEIAERRSAIQEEIKELDQKRRTYKAEQSREAAGNASLGKSMISTLKKEAKEKGYKIED